MTQTTSDNYKLLGVPRIVAEVLGVLSDGTPRTMHDIERESDLRQGEVSIAVEFVSCYVKITEKKTGGKGRPQKVVRMNRKSYEDYLDACVECYKVAYEIAVSARKELL